MSPVILNTFGASCSSGFFSFPTWYKYLEAAGKLNPAPDCQVNNTFTIPTDLPLVALGILDITIHLAALVAVGYVVFGGIQFVTSEGSPEKTQHAQGTIVNALIGLVIAIMAAGIVSYVGTRVGS